MKGSVWRKEGSEVESGDRGLGGEVGRDGREDRGVEVKVP